MASDHISTLAEEDGLQAEQSEGTVSQRPLKEHCYRNTGRLSRFEGTEVMDYGAYPVQFTMLC
jgi:hypothetical protein